MWPVPVVQHRECHHDKVGEPTLETLKKGARYLDAGTNTIVPPVCVVRQNIRVMGITGDGTAVDPRPKILAATSRSCALQ